MTTGVRRIEIVLAVVRCGGQICLARRSQGLATSRGLWSVVTGYLELAEAERSADN